jgi:hypothetical protein
MWDKKKEESRKHEKFHRLWLGPFKIEDKARADSLHLNRLNGEKLSLPMNRKILKLYFSKGV